MLISTSLLAATVAYGLLAGGALASGRIQVQVAGGGLPIGGSTVTLWEAVAGEPRRVAQGRTAEDGRFVFEPTETRGDASLYVVASGGVRRGNVNDQPLQLTD